MNELEQIEEIFSLREKSIMPCPPWLTDEERKPVLEEQSKKLQEIHKEKIELIKKVKKAQAEAISKMSDRELLEAIYRRLI